jgi:hypothetical protein
MVKMYERTLTRFHHLKENKLEIWCTDRIKVLTHESWYFRFHRRGNAAWERS